MIFVIYIIFVLVKEPKLHVNNKKEYFCCIEIQLRYTTIQVNWKKNIQVFGR